MITFCRVIGVTEPGVLFVLGPSQLAERVAVADAARVKHVQVIPALAEQDLDRNAARGRRFLVLERDLQLDACWIVSGAPDATMPPPKYQLCQLRCGCPVPR